MVTFGIVSKDLFNKWLESVSTTSVGVSIYRERSGSRSAGLKALKILLADHFVGVATVVRAGGYQKAAAIIANSLPKNKKTKSGDLGELLATEYLNAETEFVVPVNKLRWKSDSEMAMHGNDVIGVDTSTNPIRVLKGECKSRANFSNSVAEEAVESLDKHDGRPNPSTLAFIAKRLYEEARDDEANVFRDLQTGGTMAAKNVTHMIFALSGNDPAKLLAAAPKSKHRGIKRENTAILITDHSDFIDEVFNSYGT